MHRSTAKRNHRAVAKREFVVNARDELALRLSPEWTASASLKPSSQFIATTVKTTLSQIYAELLLPESKGIVTARVGYVGCPGRPPLATDPFRTRDRPISVRVGGRGTFYFTNISEALMWARIWHADRRIFRTRGLKECANNSYFSRIPHRYRILSKAEGAKVALKAITAFLITQNGHKPKAYDIGWVRHLVSLHH